MTHKTYFKPEPVKRSVGTQYSAKRCKQCGNLFDSPTYKMRTFCSHKCSNTYGNNERSEKLKVAIRCAACKQVFTKRPSDTKIYKGSLAKNKAIYCSHACWKLKTQTISSLKLRAWGVFGTYIKVRDDWTCFTCGKREEGRTMHAGHFISRRYNSTLFDERNVHAQCAGCNMFRNGEPHLYAEKLIELHGQQFLLDLIAKSKELKKFTREELQEIYDKYKV